MLLATLSATAWTKTLVMRTSDRVSEPNVSPDIFSDYFLIGDPARYYYTIGVTISFGSIISLIVTIIPVSIAKRVGFGLVIFWALCSLFIMCQVQLTSTATLIFPG